MSEEGLVGQMKKTGEEEATKRTTKRMLWSGCLMQEENEKL